MVIEHGLDALLPLAALVDERVPQAHAGSQIEQVRGWDPGLRQPPDHQQLAQMASVGAIGLGPLLAPAQAARLGRLSEMHVSADRVKLFDNEPPAGRRLQRDLQPLAGEAPEELPDAIAVRRRQPRATDFARLGVQPVGRDLCSMLIESHYDGHSGPPHAPRLITGTPRAPELRGSLQTRPDRARLMPSFAEGSSERRAGSTGWPWRREEAQSSRAPGCSNRSSRSRMCAALPPRWPSNY